MEFITRAAEQGSTKAVTLRETLEGMMIPEQLSKAQRLEAKGFRLRKVLIPGECQLRE